MVSLPTSDSSSGPNEDEIEIYRQMVEEAPGFHTTCDCGAETLLVPCDIPPNVGRLRYSCRNPEALAIHFKKFWDVAAAEEIQMVKDRVRVLEASDNVASYYTQRLEKLENEVRQLKGDVANCGSAVVDIKEAELSRTTLDKQLVDALWTLVLSAGAIAFLSAGFVAAACGISFFWVSRLSC